MSEDLIDALKAVKKQLRIERHALAAIEADDYMATCSLLAAASFINDAREAIDAAMDRLAEGE